MGAVQALLGIKGAMPLIHGSQGCSTYTRFQLCRHFREPINVSSTSMSESTVVYGGEKNLTKALENIISKYKPSLIGVTSSCLTETIGDDMGRIISKFRELYSETHGKDIPVIVPISTPSYTGSHVEGYDRTIKALLENLTIPPTEKYANNRINIVPGNLSPADIEEIKEILHLMKLKVIILTDTSESLHAPLNGSVEFLPTSGTTLDEIKSASSSKITLTLCKHADSGGKFLNKRFGVPHLSLQLPIGLENTDTFIRTLSFLINFNPKEELTGIKDHNQEKNNSEECNSTFSIPEILERDRGRLLDAMVDAQTYNYGRKVAVYGDPDMVSGLVRFLTEIGMNPTIIATGVRSKKFRKDIEQICQKTGFEPHLIIGGDLYDLSQQVKKSSVDLLIGNSYGARIAEDENIPLMRVGFPIFDRVGAQRIRILGYRGSLNLLDQLTNTIIQHYYDEAGYEIKKSDTEFNDEKKSY
jgi:nitrogenase molybdenum-iron protein beta chain